MQNFAVTLCVVNNVATVILDSNIVWLLIHVFSETSGSRISFKMKGMALRQLHMGTRSEFDTRPFKVYVGTILDVY